MLNFGNEYHRCVINNELIPKTVFGIKQLSMEIFLGVEITFCIRKLFPSQLVANVVRMTLIIKSFRHLMGQLNLPVYSTEDQRAYIRREYPTIKISADC